MSAPDPSADVVGPQCIDIRLVRLPGGEWAVSVEGHRVRNIIGQCPGAALEALANVTHTLVDAEGLTEPQVLLEAVRDPMIVRRVREGQTRLMLGLAGALMPQGGAVVLVPPPAGTSADDVLDRTPPEKLA